MFSSEADDFVKYGTPLEPLEEHEIPKKKPCWIEDQIVRDEQGRRRFHGAFTGGFSAGFYNTVGSLEGWTPASFKSSRTKKNKIFKQTPEDFMDDEDVGEFGIAPKILKARDIYLDTQTTSNKTSYHKGNKLTIGTFVFDTLLKPVRETVGVRLLKKMGWKPGQGIGPRSRKREKKSFIKSRTKMYGCMLPSETLINESFNSDSDSDSDSFWEDITFAPMDFESFLISPKNNFFGIGYQGLQRNNNQGALGKKEHVTLEAFGVGALEDEDEDIYQRDDIAQYDFSLTTENSKEEEKVKITSRINDVLNFVSSLKKKKAGIMYHLPILPKNFIYRRELEKSKLNNIQENKYTISLLLNDDLRDRCELKNATAFTKEFHSESKNSVATTSFKPFCYDSLKQERFEKYMGLARTGLEGDLDLLQPVTMDHWEKEKEKKEFNQAGSMLKSLIGIKEKKFLPANQCENLSNPLGIVEKSHDANDDTRKAAKMKLFGTLTRRIDGWLPSHLLSKRFNIPEIKASVNNILCKEKRGNNLFDKQEPVKTEKENSHHKNTDTNNCTTTESFNRMEKVGELNDLKKPDDITSKIDLFKAIFLESDEENEKEVLTLDKMTDEAMYEEKLINANKNNLLQCGSKEPNCCNYVAPCSAANNFRDNIKNADVDSSFIESNLYLTQMYGPKIPERIITNASSHAVKDPDDKGHWVEKTRHSKKKHKKKNKKNKKLHKSDRVKEKKKKRRKNI